MDTIVSKAIEAAGGATALSAALGVSVQVVSMWKKRNKIPPEYCIAVERAGRAKVTRYEMRPDVFVGPEEAAA